VLVGGDLYPVGVQEVEVLKLKRQPAFNGKVRAWEFDFTPPSGWDSSL
jgi:hypothetical protein